MRDSAPLVMDLLRSNSIRIRHLDRCITATTNACQSKGSTGGLRVFADVVLTFLDVRFEDVFE